MNSGIVSGFGYMLRTWSPMRTFGTLGALAVMNSALAATGGEMQDALRACRSRF